MVKLLTSVSFPALLRSSFGAHKASNGKTKNQESFQQLEGQKAVLFVYWLGWLSQGIYYSWKSLKTAVLKRAAG